MLQLRLLIASALPLVAHASNNAFGEEFLRKNAAKEGVISLPSGLQYKVIQTGDGEFHPLETSIVHMHHEGRTAQEYEKVPKGHVFDTSFKDPASKPVEVTPQQVIKGWHEALQLMVEGDIWELYVPAALGYGDASMFEGFDKIGPGDVLVYKIHIVQIKGGDTPARHLDHHPYTAIETVEELDKWLAESAAAGRRALLALLRQPLTKGSKLYGGFKKAARDAGPSASFALSALSKFDPESKKFTTSEVERVLGLSAPSVYVIQGAVSASEVREKGTAVAEPCVKGLSQGTTLKDVQAKVAECASPGKEEL